MLFLLILYHMQKTNFITQLILKIKLTYYSSSLCACPGMPDHIQFKQPTNICYFHGPLVTWKLIIINFNLFVRYSSLKNPAFWLALRFLDHSSRTRFLPNMLLLQKVKRPLVFPCLSKKAYIWVDKIFAKTLKTSFWGDFQCPFSPSELSFKNQDL